MTNLREQDVVPPFQSYLFDNPKSPAIRRKSWRPYRTVGFSQSERQQILLLHAERSITVSEAARLLNKPWESTRRLFRELGISPPSPRKVIPVGTRFGKVVVIDNTKTVTVGVKKKTELTASLVRCNCGTEKIIDNRNLRGGFIKSCGPCGAKERMPDSDWRAIWFSVRGRARHKKIAITLTAGDIEIIGNLPCAYCSRPPQNRFHRITYIGNRRHRDREPTFLYSGIDRVDPSKGYISGNVVPCCKFCNYAKTNRTLDDFLEQIAYYGSRLTTAHILELAQSLKTGNDYL